MRWRILRCRCGWRARDCPSLFRRRSSQRLIQAATSTNSVSVNSSFSTDHTVMRLRPLAMPMLSSVAMIGSSQPRIFGGDREPDHEHRHAHLPVLHPGLVAEADREQEHARSRTTTYAPVRRTAASMMPTSKCAAAEQPARQQHAAPGRPPPARRDDALGRVFAPGRHGRRRHGGRLRRLAQRRSDEPARQQAQQHDPDLREDVAREQDVEERLYAQRQVGHALRSGMSWLSRRAI